MEVKANQRKQMPKQGSHEDGEPVTKRYLLKADQQTCKQLPSCLAVFSFKNWEKN